MGSTRPDIVYFPEPFSLRSEVEGVALKAERCSAADLTSYGLDKRRRRDRYSDGFSVRAGAYARFHEHGVVHSVFPIVGGPGVRAIGIKLVR